MSEHLLISTRTPAHLLPDIFGDGVANSFRIFSHHGGWNPQPADGNSHLAIESYEGSLNQTEGSSFTSMEVAYRTVQPSLWRAEVNLYTDQREQVKVEWLGRRDTGEIEPSMLCQLTFAHYQKQLMLYPSTQELRMSTVHSIAHQTVSLQSDPEEIQEYLRRSQGAEPVQITQVELHDGLFGFTYSGFPARGKEGSIFFPLSVAPKPPRI